MDTALRALIRYRWVMPCTNRSQSLLCSDVHPRTSPFRRWPPGIAVEPPNLLVLPCPGWLSAPSGSSLSLARLLLSAFYSSSFPLHRQFFPLSTSSTLALCPQRARHSFELSPESLFPRVLLSLASHSFLLACSWTCSVSLDDRHERQPTDRPISRFPLLALSDESRFRSALPQYSWLSQLVPAFNSPKIYH